MRPPRNYFVRAFKRDAGMLSRVADSLYWMSRYLERAEHTARLVDVDQTGHRHGRELQQRRRLLDRNLRQRRKRRVLLALVRLCCSR